MPAIENRTSFAAIDLPSITKRAEDCLVVCVAGRFDLPPPGTSLGPAPAPSDAQEPPAVEDVYWGDPASSSLRYEGQTAYTRPGTDVIVSGRAWALRGERIKTMSVSARVGSLRRRIAVIGDRRWQRGMHGLTPTKPIPFESIPLLYERSFGGALAAPEDGGLFEARNPVGVGLYATEDEALDKPLPNIESEAALIRDIADRPPPVGFGPIARTWQPRLGYAGTFDAAWMEARAPLWPADFDERFFQAAPPGAIATPWLKGGEPVVLEGMSPDGAIAFTLPTYRLAAEATFQSRTARKPLVLDSVHIEVEERRLTLIWRALFLAHRELHRHRRTVVLALNPGEELAP